MTSAGPPRNAPETIELVEDERIAPHGSIHVWWFVEKADDYVKAGEWPGATSERLDAGPGTVWERRIRLTLPRGTRLMRVETRPRPRPLGRQDPLSYLEGEHKQSPSVTRRTYYVVTKGGRIAIEPGRKWPT